MRRFVVRVIINALALWLATWILPGMHIASSSIVSNNGAGPEGTANIINTMLAYLFIGLIFGVVNAFVKPIVKFLSLPVTILTLGLFTIVVNAAMLWLTAWVSTFTPIQFTIDDFFWTAIFAALIISVVSMFTSNLGKSKSRR
ncbi:phage holin family protein [Arthrobacter sp. E3]|uniref:phage holin family protein n=1 Tax=Arthrobacter sp. E3 TaxID=517402 RepID=UPI001A9415AF|nr:phage holin family protein [Arthrobacter sp. E3]